jgi:NAD(P)-dependent dehydrogenase (short-subunit alcohol dehydrogenase family)
LNEGGVIVFISSIFLTKPEPGYSSYVTAKAGMEHLMNALATEYPKIRFLTFRLPRVLTDQTNSPLMTKKLSSTRWVSQRLLELLAVNRSISFGEHSIFEISEEPNEIPS